MAETDYGSVLWPGWASEIVKGRHPHNGTPVFTVDPALAETAESDAPVMLLHGVGNSGAIYGPLMPSLAKLGPVVAPTMTPDLLIEDVDDREALVGTLVAFLAELHAPPWRLVGHSMGGVLTGLILRSHPEVVTSAILLNSPLPGTVERLRKGDTLDRNGRALLAMKALARVTALGRPRLPGFMRGPELAIVRAALGGFVKHPGRLDGEIISGAILRSRTTDGIDFLQLARELPVWESDPYVGCPVEVIVGDDDPLVPMSDHEALADSYPEATIHVVDECGHFAHLERPVFTLDAMTEFFTTTGAP